MRGQRKNPRKAVQPFENKKRKIDIFKNYEANGVEKIQRKLEIFSTLISKKSTQSELSKYFGPVVATGAERICVRNLNNQFSCFKISKKIHSKETRREIKYFKFLKRKGVTSSFIPAFISDFETEEEIIIEQELIADHPEQDLFAFRVEEFVADASGRQLMELEKLFQELYTELKDKNVIISDLHAGNMMIYCDKAGNIKRLIVVDGFGSPEAIPLAKYFGYFGRKKIDRQWAKFRRTFEATWERRRGGKPTIHF